MSLDEGVVDGKGGCVWERWANCGVEVLRQR